MPTHFLRSRVESPDRLTQDSSMSPNTTYSENAMFSPGGSVPSSCMFCAQTFTHQDELDPHILSQHPATIIEPGVLRVDMEFKMQGERPWAEPSVLPVEKEEVQSCMCGYISQDASQLETHMRKHKDYFAHCCSVCGRRFRHLWLLKNHLKKHIKPGPKSKAQQDPDTPVTINGTVQDLNPEPVATLYKMCMVCGFFFPDHETLVEHSKVHNRELEPGQAKAKENMDGTAEPPATQVTFLHGLKLLPRSTGKSWQQERTSKWIPQLNPFITFQAWQLATKGKLAVGCNYTKNADQEASTDNDSHSEKEELNNIPSEGQGDKVAKEGLRRELRSQRQAVAETPEAQQRSPAPKDKEKKRPIVCEERQRTLHTSQQLDLHSRVLHKHERSGEESPPAADGTLSRADEHPEEGCEEGLEEAALTENLGSDEDDRSKVKSKECTYCGKSFRSSYNLTVHLRTHTGEKPFKCVYCNYAAARKTSLKNHLDRRHMDKPSLDIPSGPVPSVPSPKSCTSGTPEEKPDIIKCPVPVHQRMEKVKEESSEVVLNLSLKVSPSTPSSPEPRDALIKFSCSFCPYKSKHPEVLIIHKRLNHKDKSDSTTATGFEGCLIRERRTGCPPALNGVDVGPLAMTDRYYIRSTKPPPGHAAKPQEQILINPPRALKRSPTHEPLLDEPISKRLKVTVDCDPH